MYIILISIYHHVIHILDISGQCCWKIDLSLLKLKSRYCKVQEMVILHVCCSFWFPYLHVAGLLSPRPEQDNIALHHKTASGQRFEKELAFTLTDECSFTVSLSSISRCSLLHHHYHKSPLDIIKYISFDSGDEILRFPECSNEQKR